MDKITFLNGQKKEGISEMEKISSFSFRNFGVMRAAQVFLVLGILISAMTEGFALLSSTGSWVFTILGVLAIEGLGYMAGSATLTNIQAGVFYQRPIHIIFFFVVAISWVGINYKSVTLSLQGAPALQRHYRTTQVPPTLHAEDSVKAMYLQRLAVIDDDIKAQKRTTWKGSITAAAQKNIAQLNRERAKVTDAMDRDVLAIREVNTGLQSDWEQKTQAGEQEVYFFAGLGEAIKFVCMMLVFLYRVSRNEELGLHRIESALGMDLDGDGQIGTPPPSSAQRAPGFHRVAAEDTRPKAITHPDAVEDPAQVVVDRRPIGFNYEKAAHPTTEQNVRNSIGATSSTISAANELLDLYRKHRSRLARYSPNNYNGAEETRVGWVNRIQAEIDDIEKRLAQLGFTVVKNSNRYQLKDMNSR